MNKPVHRVLTYIGAAVLALALTGCTSTAQKEENEQSIPGRPNEGGGGGSGGGSGGGTGLGGASGGAGDGVNTAPSAMRPEVTGIPSMPQDGSKPNPAPATSIRTASGVTLEETGTAPESGPESIGAVSEGSENGGEAGGVGLDGGADGTGSNPNVDGAMDPLDQAGAETAAADASGQHTNEAGQTTGDTGLGGSDESGGAPGQTAGESGEDGDEAGRDNGELAQAGAGSDASGEIEDGTGSDNGEGQDAAAPPGATGGAGPMTLDERRAAIRGRVDASFAVIDGLTLAERERVQRAANAGGLAALPARGTGAGDTDSEQNGGGGDGTGERSVVIVANNSGTGGATMPTAVAGRLGEFDNGTADVTYPIPIDIPSGDDDDVVARQLREAATREPDPELREKLWDEYREYTGLGP